jgi:hypothetical protein
MEPIKNPDKTKNKLTPVQPKLVSFIIPISNHDNCPISEDM